MANGEQSGGPGRRASIWRRDFRAAGLAIAVAVLYWIIFVTAAGYGLVSLVVRVDRGPTPGTGESIALSVVTIMSFPLVLLVEYSGWEPGLVGMLFIVLANGLCWGTVISLVTEKLRRRKGTERSTGDL